MSYIGEAYRHRVQEGELTVDEAQIVAVEALGRVETRLSAGESGLLGHLFHNRTEPARGAYLWGPPGGGKSMLMDLFCAGAPVEAKRRVHFHAFMSEVQGRLEELRHGSRQDGDVVIQVADELAERVRLLCFDELEVVDIADAMILGRLFQRLFEKGVVLVATSNEAPDDLYREGINRQLFEPFIELIKVHTEVVELASARDYRRGDADGEARYLSPVSADTRSQFDKAWRTATQDSPPSPTKLEVHGRTVRLSEAAGDKLRATFEELCGRELGADDYLAIANRFGTLFLGPVSIQSGDQADTARRLVLLIDALYEAHATLFVLAEAEPDGLFEVQTEAAQRTMSRLEEMRRPQWPPR